MRTQKPARIDSPFSLVEQRARQYAPLMKPGEMFSHTTALELHKCPIRARRILHVSVPYGRSVRQVEGLQRHRFRASPQAVDVRGLTTASPFTALAQSASILSEQELTVAIDHLIRAAAPGSNPVITIAEIEAGLARSKFVGRPRLRAALSRARFGSDSRYETLMRLSLEEHGITDLELQVPLNDAQGFVGRFDALSRSRKCIFEYDGEQHRLDRKQYLTDLDRLDRAHKLGWHILRFHHEDFVDYPARFDAKLARMGY